MGRRRRLSRSQWCDAALAAGALAISASVLTTMPSWDPPPVAALLVLAHVTPIAFGRRSPRAAFAVSVGAGVVYLAAGWPMVGLGVAALVMTYSLAAYSARVDSVVGVVAIELRACLDLRGHVRSRCSPGRDVRGQRPDPVRDGGAMTGPAWRDLEIR